MQLQKNLKDLMGALTFVGIGLILTMSNVQALDEAAQLKLGENEFIGSCAACHGANARGEGPVAQVLSTKPSDLTQISKKFNDQFPAEHIYKVIDGRVMINPHGDKQMPIWGFRYMSEAHSRASQVPHDVDTQAMVFGRIMSLVGYLESIQDK